MASCRVVTALRRSLTQLKACHWSAVISLLHKGKVSYDEFAKGCVCERERERERARDRERKKVSERQTDRERERKRL